MKHVFKNTAADELIKSYDDFFLNKADDIAEQLKMAPGVNDFEAHQMVCEMVQVSQLHSVPICREGANMTTVESLSNPDTIGTE